MYGFEYKTITRKELMQQLYAVSRLVDWTNIIYVGGGNTLDIITLWNETGFNKII